jgi:hypothetical protein
VAIEAASGDWILEVDADERVTPALRAEIEAFLASPPAGVDIGALPMGDIFLGREIRHASKYPKYRYRMFRREAYRHDETRAVHEGLWANGRAWGFAGELVHLLAESWREAIGDARTYARLEAAQQGPAPSMGAAAAGIVARPLAKFGYRLVVDGGWRDGWRGVVKIGLDCWADSAVWARRMRERPGADGTPSPTVPGHFGQRSPRRGSVRIVALVAGDGPTERAASWLRAAAAAGADVGLVTDTPPPPDPALHVRALARFSPLRVLRGLDAEDQLRPIDAVVAFGARARWLARMTPGRRRREWLEVDPERDPAGAAEDVRAATRGGVPPSA